MHIHRRLNCCPAEPYCSYTGCNNQTTVWAVRNGRDGPYQYLVTHDWSDGTADHPHFREDLPRMHDTEDIAISAHFREFSDPAQVEVF